MIFPQGFGMIEKMRIANFKCFENLNVEGCKKINIIVGDNGVGKTALLEAIFFALCSGPEIAFRIRGQRGLPNLLQIATHTIVRSAFGDLFRNYDLSNPPSIQLTGDRDETRSVEILLDPPDATVASPLTSAGINFVQTGVLFKWTNSKGEHVEYRPTYSTAGLVVGSSKEVLPDFFYFPSTLVVPAEEHAQRYSELRRNKRAKLVVEALQKEFPWISDISIDVTGGAAGLVASVGDDEMLLPLAGISGAMNRVIGVLLAMATREHSVVLVDEIENGIFHERHGSICKHLLNFSDLTDCQLFLSTHSQEWLDAFIFEAKGGDVDFEIWQIVRNGNKQPTLRRFGRDRVFAAFESGSDFRGTTQ